MEVGWLASRSRETNKKSLPWTVATQVKTLQGDQGRPTGRLENIQREDAVTTSFHQLDFPIVNLPNPVKKKGKIKSFEDLLAANNLRIRITNREGSVGGRQS